MRIVFSADWHSDGMGYHENVIPRTLVQMGHEVYIVSSTMQFYGDHPFYKEVYEAFLGPSELPAGESVVDGVKVIRLPIALWWKRLRIARGRVRTIRDLKPDVVYSYDPRSYQSVAIALAAQVSPFTLYVASHTVATMYPAFYSFDSWSARSRIRLRLTDTLLGWICSWGARRCFGVTQDAASIAVKFFGFPAAKVEHLPLPLDTVRFSPPESREQVEARRRRRAALGYGDSTVVCIYTGRLTKEKDPLSIAVAVASLREKGHDFATLIVGVGEQAAEIRELPGATVLPFVPHSELADYYRAADVGVWPWQESNSNLDAAACGLPVVVSRRIQAANPIPGRLEFDEHQLGGLEAALLQLEDRSIRSSLGQAGNAAMQKTYSHQRHAEYLLQVFSADRGIEGQAMTGATP